LGWQLDVVCCISVFCAACDPYHSLFFSSSCSLSLFSRGRVVLCLTDDFELAMKVVSVDRRNSPRRNLARAPNGLGAVDMQTWLPVIARASTGSPDYPPSLFQLAALNLARMVEIVVKSCIREHVRRSGPEQAANVALSFLVGPHSDLRAEVVRLFALMKLPLVEKEDRLSVETPALDTWLASECVQHLMRFEAASDHDHPSTPRAPDPSPAVVEKSHAPILNEPVVWAAEPVERHSRLVVGDLMPAL
jgi:hypothetical protein